jgi:hypothetical protein
MPGDEHWEFAVSVPAHTAVATPQTTITKMTTPRRLVGIDWTVPPGASGQMGWRFTMGAIQVIPVNKGAWLIRDGSAGGNELDRLPDSGAWEVTAYNTGALAHTLYVSYYANIIRPTVKLVTPFGLDQLQQAITSPPAHSTASRML